MSAVQKLNALANTGRDATQNCKRRANVNNAHGGAQFSTKGALAKMSGGMTSTSLYGGGLRSLLPVKHKVFVSYHHAGDQAYYSSFSTTFHDNYEVIYDKSLARTIDSDDVDYVRRRIREDYIVGSSCTIVLVGNETWARKYVDWEIDATLQTQHGLIGVCLPTAARNSITNKIIVPDRLFDNIQTGFALWLTWEQITANTAQLERYIADAKSRSAALIDNSRDRRLKNS